MATIKRNASGSILRNSGGNIVNSCDAAECDQCIGNIMPASRTARIAGILDAGCICTGLNDEFILTSDPSIGGGPCKLVYLEENFCGSDTLAMTLEFFNGEVIFTLSIGALSGSVVFRKAAPAAPYNCGTESLGEYVMISNTSFLCDFTGMQLEIAA